MKVEIDKKCKEEILGVIKQVLDAKKEEVNEGKFVEVLQEIGATGARVFIKEALELFNGVVISGTKNIAELIDEL